MRFAKHVPASVSCFLFLAFAAAAATTPQNREWTVDGATRTGIVYAPEAALQSSAPVVFVFHGHGGTAQHAARTMAYHTQWPEAIVVYLQGLPTPGQLTDPEGKRPGWQKAPGDQNDRDDYFHPALLGPASPGPELAAVVRNPL